MDSSEQTYQDGYEQGYADCEGETTAAMLEEHGHRMKAIGLPRLIAGLIKQPGVYWESVITAALSGDEGAAYQLATHIEAMEKVR